MGACSAPKCTNSPEKGFRVFKFPADPLRCGQWVEYCLRLNKTFSLKKYSGLCTVHFDESQFEQHREDGKKKLKPNAVPTTGISSDLLFSDPLSCIKIENFEAQVQQVE